VRGEWQQQRGSDAVLNGKSGAQVHFGAEALLIHRAGTHACEA
jgi:hypothetical protein